MFVKRVASILSCKCYLDREEQLCFEFKADNENAMKIQKHLASFGYTLQIGSGDVHRFNIVAIQEANADHILIVLSANDTIDLGFENVVAQRTMSTMLSNVRKIGSAFKDVAGDVVESSHDLIDRGREIADGVL